MDQFAALPILNFSSIFKPLTESEQYARLTLMIADGIHPNAKDVTRKTLMRFACKSLGAPCIKLLIDAGANKNDLDTFGRPLILTACHNTDRNSITVLLEARDDVNIKAREIYSALVYACKYCETETVQTLIMHGAKINEQGADGFLPITCAAKNGQTKTVELLLTSGSQIDALPINTGNQYIEAYGQYAQLPGMTSLAYAIKSCGYRCVQLLIEYGADVNAYNNSITLSPIFLACKTGQLDIAILLIANGCHCSIQELKTFPIIGQLFYYIDVYDNKGQFTKRAVDFS